jgi:hypothetical protein
MIHIKRETTQSIPVPEQPMMEAANPRTWDQQPSSSSGVGSLIRALEGLFSGREQTLEQVVTSLVTMTTENLIVMSEEFGVKIPKGLKHAGNIKKCVVR